MPCIMSRESIVGQANNVWHEEPAHQAYDVANLVRRRLQDPQLSDEQYRVLERMWDRKYYRFVPSASVIGRLDVEVHSVSEYL